MDGEGNFTAEADEDLEDEEGGRFFGGGITQREKEILDFMDDEEDQGVRSCSIPGIAEYHLAGLTNEEYAILYSPKKLTSPTSENSP